MSWPYQQAATSQKHVLTVNIAIAMVAMMKAFELRIFRNGGGGASPIRVPYRKVRKPFAEIHITMFRRKQYSKQEEEQESLDGT